jgi:chemotaxis protein methyltransferase CheR
MTDREGIERFRSTVERRLGLRFDDVKLEHLQNVLERRVEARALTEGEYLGALEGGDFAAEVPHLARELTVGETYFFRNVEQFHAFEAVIAKHDGAVRVLSAGCASGEEPYSLAMMVAGQRGTPASVSITGADLGTDALERAARGRYSAWALRETPNDVRSRWFRCVGREYVLDEAIRSAVTFTQRNLAEEDPDLWRRGAWDVVFCRNVLMYFAPDAARAVVARIARSLCPGGHLFLGHAETLRGISDEFDLCHTHGTFYYQLRDGKRASRQSSPEPATPFLPTVAAADTWVDSIRKATDRIQQLSWPPDRQAGQRPVDVRVARELFEQEQYTDALRAVSDLPASAARDPDVLLLRAVLLVNQGELADAERVCRGLLEVDGTSAGAHYLLALCREGAGDRDAAIDHDQTAAYLEPTFAMPRLHLGLLARRAGDANRARRELAQALTLLIREDPSRLRLYGGGFSRQALVDLCRAEIAACGGAS